MKKISKLLFIIIFGLSCADKEKKEYTPLERAQIRKISDSFISSAEKRLATDTTGLKDSPVKVLSCKFITREYSTYKDIQMSYKNVSNKTITAVKFEWYGENAFGEPADMGFQNGRGGGFDDKTLKPGRTSSGTWSILSRDGKKIINAHAYKVVFQDGNIWELKQ